MLVSAEHSIREQSKKDLRQPRCGRPAAALAKLIGAKTYLSLSTNRKSSAWAKCASISLICFSIPPILSPYSIRLFSLLLSSVRTEADRCDHFSRSLRKEAV